MPNPQGGVDAPRPNLGFGLDVSSPKPNHPQVGSGHVHAQLGLDASKPNSKVVVEASMPNLKVAVEASMSMPTPKLGLDASTPNYMC